MARSIRFAVSLALLAALALGTGAATAAPGHHHKVLDARMTGIPASMAGLTLFGVTGGGLPWSLDRGTAKLFSDGRLEVDVHHLVLAGGPPSIFGTNPIPTGQAILTCAGSVAAMSTAVPFSSTGDARVRMQVDLPSSCLGPVVFFAGITGNGPRWFAITGW